MSPSLLIGAFFISEKWKPHKEMKIKANFVKKVFGFVASCDIMK